MNNTATQHPAPDLARHQTPIFGHLIDQPTHHDLAADFPDGTLAERGDAWALAEEAGLVPPLHVSLRGSEFERRMREVAEAQKAKRDREVLWFWTAVSTLLAVMGVTGLLYVFLAGEPSAFAVLAAVVAIVTGAACVVASLQLVRRSERESAER